MANRLFDAGRERFLGGDNDWDANVIKLVFVDIQDDDPNTTTDDFLNDIAVAARVAISGAFAGKTKNQPVGGVADANDITLPGVSGDPFEVICIFVDIGVESGSSLIARIDQATGLPLSPNGGDVTVVWDPGDNRIFKL